MRTWRNWKGVGPAAAFSASFAAPPSASASAAFVSSASTTSVSEPGPARFPAGPTYSRRIVKCGSCVASDSMIRSASRPWRQWRVFGS